MRVDLFIVVIFYCLVVTCVGHQYISRLSGNHFGFQPIKIEKDSLLREEKLSISTCSTRLILRKLNSVKLV